MAKVRVAAHQPNYMPWQGYFNKLANCDVFVLLDNVQLERRGLTHRTRILGHRQGDAPWISQSLKKRAIHEQNILDTQFADLHWVRKHLNTLKTVYGKARHFKEMYPALESAMLVNEVRLADYNTRLIATVAGLLGIRTPMVRASTLCEGTACNASERLAALTRMVGGDVYLSGQGAKAYNDDNVFRRHGVKLEYLQFRPAPYAQGAAAQFVPNLSVMDALFHLGPKDTVSLIAKGNHGAR